MGFDVAGFGAIADFAGTVINKIFPDKFSDAEKAQATLELQKLLQARDENLITAQKEIIISEMSQQDAFTKQARPMIVYAGLLFIFLIHVVFPMITYATKEVLPALALPQEFWWAWSGVCGVWIIGRSYEKVQGVANLITGK